MYVVLRLLMLQHWTSGTEECAEEWTERQSLLALKTKLSAMSTCSRGHIPAV